MDQFVWTKKFNRILSMFCDECPITLNRHYFRSIPKSFSGREALDAMERVLSDVFPENDNLQRSNAQKLLELYLKDGIILGVHKVDQVKDEKDVFYRLNKQLTDKYTFRPRRSVSVDDNRKRFTQPRMSIISPEHFNSEPEICSPSTSSHTANNSIMNSTESVNEEQQKPNRMEVDAAAKRFIHWIQKDQSISEKQRKKTMEAFKAHYPAVYRDVMLQTPQKSPSISSAPCYQHQYSLPSAPLSPSTSNYSIQSDLARSIDELNQQRAPESKLPNRLSEADFNMQLLKKLDSVIENPIYGERERRRILNYFKHTFPTVYRQRFNGSTERPLLKKIIKELLPQRSVVKCGSNH